MQCIALWTVGKKSVNISSLCSEGSTHTSPTETGTPKENRWENITYLEIMREEVAGRVALTDQEIDSGDLSSDQVPRVIER